MNSTYSDFINSSFSLKKEATKKKKKHKLIIGVIVGIILLAVVIVIAIFAIPKGEGSGSGNGGTPQNESDPNKDSDGNNEDDQNDSDDKNDDSGEETKDQPIFINISYNKDELKFFNIEKNISSTINGEGNKREQNNTFYYVCTLGIRNKNGTGNINDTYYEGFFAVLSQFHYNETTKENDLILDNSELVNIIINKQNDNLLLQD